MLTFCINHNNTCPFFNLAAEEYFLKNFQEDFFILWHSRPSVVVGRHQNTLAEINPFFIEEHEIAVARRISGGGTVFHDLGNMNFSFIRKTNNVEETNSNSHISLIINVLNKLNIEAQLSGSNDIIINGKKISGNAVHVHKNRILNHGTLLFDSKLDMLSNALKAGTAKFDDKAVQSRRSTVDNISTYLKTPLSTTEFSDFLFNEIVSQLPDTQVYVLTESDTEAIANLAKEKYQTWDWIFGNSPRYRFSNNVNTAEGTIHINLLINKGLIVEAKLSGTIEKKLSDKIEESLLGLKHGHDETAKAIAHIMSNLPQYSRLSLALLKGLL